MRSCLLFMHNKAKYNRQGLGVHYNYNYNFVSCLQNFNFAIIYFTIGMSGKPRKNIQVPQGAGWRDELPVCLDPGEDKRGGAML